MGLVSFDMLGGNIHIIAIQVLLHRLRVLLLLLRADSGRNNHDHFGRLFLGKLFQISVVEGSAIRVPQFRVACRRQNPLLES